MIELKTAKSNFPCSWCGEAIEKGAEYVRRQNYDTERGFCGRLFHHPECETACNQSGREEWPLRVFKRGTQKIWSHLQWNPQ